ncbi:hypothetical protein IAT38_001390 [Cryptococcus sp. DSM 104549]
MSFLPLSPCCLGGGIIYGTPRGVIEPPTATRKVNRYHATPPDGVFASETAAVILYTDFFCFSLPNAFLIADAYAEKLKLHVYVPEYIPNAPPPEIFDHATPIYPGMYASRSWLSTIWEFTRMFVRAWRWIPGLVQLKRQLPLALQALDDVKQEGYTKVGAVGYCRGGAMIQHILASPSAASLDVGVVAHPSPESATWPKINKPTLWLLSGQDWAFKNQQIAELDRVMGEKKGAGVEYERVLYEDTVHGFANRPVKDHEPTQKAFEDANARGVAFLRNYLLGAV